MRKLLSALVVVLLLGAAYSSVYTVDRTEYVYVTQFGRHIATCDGETEGGLYWKWPWPIQSVQRLDRRIQYLDLPEAELLTRDRGPRLEFLGVLPWAALVLATQKDALELAGDRNPLGATNTIDKNITVSAYICWRIAGHDSVDLFYRRVRSPEQAKTLLRDQVKSQLAATIGQKRMDDLISVEPGKVDSSLREIHQQLMDRLKERVLAYGIELVDIRLRRFGYPEKVQETIFQRIRSEREIKAAKSRSEGEAEAARLRSEAETERADLINQADDARRRAEQEGKRRAQEIRFLAYRQDQELAEYLIEATQLVQALNPSKTVLLVSMKELYLQFLRPPGTNGRIAGTEGDKPPKVGGQ